MLAIVVPEDGTEVVSRPVRIAVNDQARREIVGGSRWRVPD